MAMENKRPTKQEADKVYEQYIKPLEMQHKNQYVVVTPDGKTVFAPSLVEAMQQGVQAFGKGNFVFKVGEKVVGQLL
jgi:hypothetical protein